MCSCCQAVEMDKKEKEMSNLSFMMSRIDRD